jgi:hypothetical protein
MMVLLWFAAGFMMGVLLRTLVTKISAWRVRRHIPNAYYGSRVETFPRREGTPHLYDVNSAYPKDPYERRKG